MLYRVCNHFSMSYIIFLEYQNRQSNPVCHIYFIFSQKKSSIQTLLRTEVPKVFQMAPQGSTGQSTGVHVFLNKKWGFIIGIQRSTTIYLVSISELEVTHWVRVYLLNWATRIMKTFIAFTYGSTLVVERIMFKKILLTFLLSFRDSGEWRSRSKTKPDQYVADIAYLREFFEKFNDINCMMTSKSDLNIRSMEIPPSI